jgi:DUF4097 and DUF4098 domain-containing protein YvlB
MKKVFDTPEAVSLVVHVPAGRVELTATDTVETVVEVTPLVDDPASLRAVDECAVEMHVDKGRSVVRINVRSKGLPFLSSEPHVHVLVQAPEHSDLDATVNSAEVSARGSFGAARLKSASGDLKIENVAGLDVKTASGDARILAIAGTAKLQSASGGVDIGHVQGAAKILTASGDVNVGRAGSGLKIQSASGDVRIGAVASGQISLQSASGDMRIGVARGSTLWVDAKSLSGDTTSELDVGEAPPDIEGPHVDLQATSMSGDIHVTRADALI